MIWKHYLKLSTDGTPAMAQQTYEPLVSNDGKVFCKNYNWDNNYQRMYEDRPLYTPEVVDWFFQNELKYIEYFKNKSYAPEILDIDVTNKKIYLKWYEKSCNQVIYSGEDWPKEDWLGQIKNIMCDQYQEGIYKLTMYPHCHYIDSSGNMRAIDWYGCVPVNNPVINEKYMKGIIHKTAQFRLDETGPAVNEFLNLEIMFKQGLANYVLWGDCNLTLVHKELFGA
jgi:hypothetical protein